MITTLSLIFVLQKNNNVCCVQNHVIIYNHLKEKNTKTKKESKIPGYFIQFSLSYNIITGVLLCVKPLFRVTIIVVVFYFYKIFISVYMKIKIK